MEAMRGTVGELTGVRSAVGQEIGDLSRLMNELRTLAASVRDGVGAETAALAGALTAARADGTAVREELQNQTADLTAAAEHINARLAGIGVLLDARAEAVINAADRALARAGELGAVFEQQSAMLGGAVTQAANAAESLAGRLRAESDGLAQAAAAIAERSETLQKSQQRQVRDMFLRTASTMIDELNALALDIHQLLDSDIPDDIWKAFRQGDRSVFARRLFRLKDSYTIPAIEQRFDRDDRFRELVTRYMGKFEDLLRESNAADPESVLNATFITADVGKLYLVLSRSLDKAGHRRVS
jgi:ABC-type transporter Mla subunit MlaD